MRAFIAAIAAILFFAVPALAEDEVLHAITGQQLVDILEGQGFAADLTHDGYGDPLVVAQAGGIDFTIITYGCDGASVPACARLQMAAQFALPEGASEGDIAMMNAYNQRFLFGRAYIDQEGAATVDYVINLNRGISEDNLMENLMIWLHVLNEFVNGLGGRDVATS